MASPATYGGMLKAKKAAASAPTALKAPKATKRTTNQGPQFYEQDGLKIPLYFPDTKRRRNARSSEKIASKTKLNELEQIVKEYSNEAKLKELRNDSSKDVPLKTRLADWVAEVELIAMPKGGAKNKAALKEDLAMVSESSEESDYGLISIVNAEFDSANGNKTAHPFASRRNDIFENRTLSSTGTMIASPAIIPHGGPKSLSELYGPATPAPTHNNKRAPVEGEEEDGGLNLSGASHPKKAKKSPVQSSFPTDPAQNGMASAPKEQVMGDALVQEAAKSALPTRRDVVMKDMKRHPLLDILGLDPSHHSTATKIAHFCERRETVIITATSQTTVHEVTIPCTLPVKARYVKFQPAPAPLPKPYLKEGMHGYLWDEHRWAFADDLDLETGVGHQVELEDQKRLDSDTNFRQEFYDKYPGRVAHLWPCGCARPLEGDESEEE